MKVELMINHELQKNQPSNDLINNSNSNDNKLENYPIKSMKTHSMHNFKELITRYLKEERPNTLEDLKNIEYLCSIEKNERRDCDIILLTEYLLKTDLFRGFKQMKIEEQIYTSLLTALCVESNLLLISDNQTAVYKTGDIASFYYLILQGKVSVIKPIEEKKTMTLIEYLDHLSTINYEKDKVLFEKTIQANNHILYINKFKEEESEIRNLIFREGTHDSKNIFSLFTMTETGEIDVFGDFGGKALELKNKKRGETIMTLAENTILLAVDELIYKEKVSRELNNIRIREVKFLNENFFLQNISRFNFLNKVFDCFKFEEFKKGDVIISDKNSHMENHNDNDNSLVNNAEQEKNYVYFLREGVLDVTINLSLIELINLIKNLVYRRDYFIKDFFHNIDLDMKNQPEKFLDELKKKKCMNLFRLSTYDCIGIEQIYYRKSDLYQVTVASETAKLYRLGLEDLKQIFKINKNSLSSFNNYIKKKMQNLIKRLISCKDMIIHKIDSSEDYPKEAKLNNEKNNSTGSVSNNYLSKIQNSFFKMNQSLVGINELGAVGTLNYNNPGYFIKEKNNSRARSSVLTKPPPLENKIINENILNSNIQILNSIENMNTHNDNYKNSNRKKNKSVDLTNKARSKDQIKKYKIIENGEDLNIQYKNHKSPKEFSKLNDKLFTMLNSSSKYKIPNIDKIIQEEVEKMNKPLSELKREQLNLKRSLKSETVNLNSKDKSLNLTTNQNNSNHNLNRKFITSANLNNNKTRKDLNNSSHYKKKISPTKLHKKLSNHSGLNDEYRMDLEKEFFDSPQSNKVKQINSPSENFNNSEYNFNEIYGNPVLSPTFSMNSNKNFKNLENMLKNEHLNIVVSKIKNLNHINRNKKFDFGFKYDYNNFINTNSFSNFYIGDPKNVLESPMSIYNVSNRNTINSFSSYINFASANNTTKYTLKRVVDDHNSNPNIISNIAVKKDVNYLSLKDIKDSAKKIINKEPIVSSQSLKEDLYPNIKKSEENANTIINLIEPDIGKKMENNKIISRINSNNNDDLNFEIPNIIPKPETELIEAQTKITETADKNINTDKELKVVSYSKIQEDQDEIAKNPKIINEKKIENFLNHNADNNKKNENPGNTQIDEDKVKTDKATNMDINDSSKDSKKLKLIRPVSFMNSSRKLNYNTVNITTNQSNLDNLNELNFNSNQNQFLISNSNVIEDKNCSNLQTIKGETHNVADFNQTFKNNLVTVDKETNANLDSSNKLINIKITQIMNENKNLNNSKKNTSHSLLHFKNLKGNGENNLTRNKKDGINFSNSILNNRITPNNNNNNNNPSLYKSANNVSNVKKTNTNQVKFINITSPIYNAKNNCYEDTETANFSRFNPQAKIVPDVEKIDELNRKRLGLKSVKVRIPPNQNISEKNFIEKFKAFNTSKNAIKGNNITSNNNKNQGDSKDLRSSIDVKRVSVNF